ncbi:hypothetical protein BGX38DRAFT_1147597 [Terfezia claveryi]|nr:hypothetical protein BGX38DRAFT_1147597 [Terfezia claveryi]
MGVVQCELSEVGASEAEREEGTYCSKGSERSEAVEEREMGVLGAEERESPELSDETNSCLQELQPTQINGGRRAFASAAMLESIDTASGFSISRRIDITAVDNGTDLEWLQIQQSSRAVSTAVLRHATTITLPSRQMIGLPTLLK